MTKTAITRELRNIRYELERLSRREKEYNPDWRFMPTPYGKRRTRLVKTYWALKVQISEKRCAQFAPTVRPVRLKRCRKDRPAAREKRGCPRGRGKEGKSFPRERAMRGTAARR